VGTLIQRFFLLPSRCLVQAVNIAAIVEILKEIYAKLFLLWACLLGKKNPQKNPKAPDDRNNFDDRDEKHPGRILYAKMRSFWRQVSI
jgi:hypothetical protein